LYQLLDFCIHRDALPVLNEAGFHLEKTPLTFSLMVDGSLSNRVDDATKPCENQKRYNE
jgi:hypothetical protein